MKNGHFFPDHPYRILIVGGSWSRKTSALLNLIKEQDNIDKIYLYAKDLSETKYEFLFKKCEDVGIKHYNVLNAFVECSNTMADVYENIDAYNPSRKRNILIVLMTWLQTLWQTKNFKLQLKNYLLGAENWITLVFMTQSYFFLRKDMRLNSTHCLIMKINSKKESQNIVINHSADIDYKDFMKIYRECIKELYSFLTIDTTLSASDPLRYRKNFCSYKNDSNWSNQNFGQKN